MKLLNILFVTVFSFLLFSCSKNEQKSPVSTSRTDQLTDTATGAVVLVGSFGGFYCLNATDGSIKWSYTGPGNRYCQSTPCVSGQHVFYNVGDSFFCVQVNTGAVVWGASYKATRGAIAIANGKLYFTQSQGCVCLNATTGKRLWGYNFGAAVPLFYPVSSPTVVNNIVYVGGGKDNYLYALNANTGSLIWKRALDHEAWSSPCINNNIVYMQTTTTVYAFNAATGDSVWHKTLSPATTYPGLSATVINNKLYVSGEKLHCFNKNGGDSIWSFADTSSQHAYMHVDCFANSNYVYGIFYDRCYRLDLLTGKLYWSRQLERTDAGIVDGMGSIFFSGYDSGNCFAVKDKNGEAKWAAYLNSQDNMYAAPIVITNTGKVIYPTGSGMQQ